MIDQTFRDFVSKIYPLNDDELSALQQCFNPAIIGKKDFLLKEGQISGKLYFIKSGLYRGYYIKDTEEITVSFHFGPGFYADVVSIFEKTPTRVNLQAMEDSEVWFGDVREIEKLGLTYPALLTLFLRYYEIIFSFSQKRQLSFIFDSAEDRYLKLINERPKVMERIPLVYIASYPGIKPESLSRIRKKIMHH